MSVGVTDLRRSSRTTAWPQSTVVHVALCRADVGHRRRQQLANHRVRPLLHELFGGRPRPGTDRSSATRQARGRVRTRVDAEYGRRDQAVGGIPVLRGGQERHGTERQGRSGRRRYAGGLLHSGGRSASQSAERLHSPRSTASTHHCLDGQRRSFMLWHVGLAIK